MPNRRLRRHFSIAGWVRCARIPMQMIAHNMTTHVVRNSPAKSGQGSVILPQNPSPPIRPPRTGSSHPVPSYGPVFSYRCVAAYVTSDITLGTRCIPVKKIPRQVEGRRARGTATTKLFQKRSCCSKVLLYKRIWGGVRGESFLQKGPPQDSEALSNSLPSERPGLGKTAAQFLKKKWPLIGQKSTPEPDRRRESRT
jgi:hypothetical protein